MTYMRSLCSPCIDKIDGSFAFTVTKITNLEKCTCAECGAKGYGYYCRVDSLRERPGRQEPHEARDRDAR